MRRLVLGILVLAAPAQAKCDKSMVERLQFLVPFASTDFAAIRGPLSAPGDPANGVGGQYSFSSAASAYCPNAMILENTPARGKYAEFWEVKFDAFEVGTGDDVAVMLIKRLSPVLKAAGYQDKPYINPGDDPGTYSIEWDGPSNTWVSLHTFLESDRPGSVGYEIKVAHDVK